MKQIVLLFAALLLVATVLAQSSTQPIRVTVDLGQPIESPPSQEQTIRNSYSDFFKNPQVGKTASQLKNELGELKVIITETQSGSLVSGVEYNKYQPLTVCVQSTGAPIPQSELSVSLTQACRSGELDSGVFPDQFSSTVNPIASSGTQTCFDISAVQLQRAVNSLFNTVDPSTRFSGALNNCELGVVTGHIQGNTLVGVNVSRLRIDIPKSIDVSAERTTDGIKVFFAPVNFSWNSNLSIRVRQIIEDQDPKPLAFIGGFPLSVTVNNPTQEDSFILPFSNPNFKTIDTEQFDSPVTLQPYGNLPAASTIRLELVADLRGNEFAKGSAVVDLAPASAPATEPSLELVNESGKKTREIVLDETKDNVSIICVKVGPEPTQGTVRVVIQEPPSSTGTVKIEFDKTEPVVETTSKDVCVTPTPNKIANTVKEFLSLKEKQMRLALEWVSTDGIQKAKEFVFPIRKKTEPSVLSPKDVELVLKDSTGKKITELVVSEERDPFDVICMENSEVFGPGSEEKDFIVFEEQVTRFGLTEEKILAEGKLIVPDGFVLVASEIPPESCVKPHSKNLVSVLKTLVKNKKDQAVFVLAEFDKKTGLTKAIKKFQFKLKALDPYAFLKIKSVSNDSGQLATNDIITPTGPFWAEFSGIQNASNLYVIASPMDDAVNCAQLATHLQFDLIAPSQNQGLYLNGLSGGKSGLDLASDAELKKSLEKLSTKRNSEQLPRLRVDKILIRSETGAEETVEEGQKVVIQTGADVFAILPANLIPKGSIVRMHFVLEQPEQWKANTVQLEACHLFPQIGKTYDNRKEVNGKVTYEIGEKIELGVHAGQEDYRQLQVGLKGCETISECVLLVDDKIVDSLFGKIVSVQPAQIKVKQDGKEVQQLSEETKKNLSVCLEKTGLWIDKTAEYFEITGENARGKFLLWSGAKLADVCINPADAVLQAIGSLSTKFILRSKDTQTQKPVELGKTIVPGTNLVTLEELKRLAESLQNQTNQSEYDFLKAVLQASPQDALDQFVVFQGVVSKDPTAPPSNPQYLVEFPLESPVLDHDETVFFRLTSDTAFGWDNSLSKTIVPGKKYAVYGFTKEVEFVVFNQHQLFIRLEPAVIVPLEKTSTESE